jgi:N-acetylmuramoyl-L-alanine amidase
VNARRTLLLTLPLLLVLLGQTPRPAPPSGPPSGPIVVLEGRAVDVPVTLAPGGPMVALAPLVVALGGTLTEGAQGESYTLTLGETEIILGVGSAVITVGDTIASLSSPPILGDLGPQVPLDFLNRTFGDLEGWAFDWRPEQQRLTIGRRSARELHVVLDVVHLQGMTTVVLQFDATPRYRLREQPGFVTVEMLGDRLAVPPVPPQVDNPLVRGVQIAPEQVLIGLAAGAEVESYVLENPFRLVFDIHQPSAVTSPTAPSYSPVDLPPGIRTLVIDPGHGGTETGAIGTSGGYEKDLTLLLAQALAARIQQRLPVRVVLTRNEDVNLAFDTRTAIANQNKADLFISIHLNSSLGAGATGAETYFLSSRPTDQRAALSAETENLTAPGLGTEPRDEVQDDLQLMLWDLAQAHHLSESQRFAALVQGELNAALQLKDRGVKQAPFRVLMGAAMPAVLVELGFLSNPEEEKKLQDPAYRAELADALVRAIVRYKETVEAPATPPTPAAGAVQQGAAGLVQPSAPAPTPGAAPGARPPAQPVPRPTPSSRPPGTSTSGAPAP